MEYNLNNPLLINFINGVVNTEDDHIPSLFLNQTHHMVSLSYLNSLKSRHPFLVFRRHTLSAIIHFCFNLDPFITYLAANYLDRFLSNQSMPKETKPWMYKLLAISCTSLAAKMTNAQFNLTDIQANEGYIFDTRSIERMEYLILGALQWRMRSITPFSFLSFFISLLQLDEPPSPIKALKARAVEIIFEVHNDFKLLAMKPSLICASAILSASKEQFPNQFDFFKQSILSCSYVDKEEMLQCYNAIQTLLMEDYSEEYDTSDTPVNVLDGQFSTDDTL